jgi:hypothetical protein
MPKSQDKCTHQYLVLEDVSEDGENNTFHYLCEVCEKVFDFFEEKPTAEPINPMHYKPSPSAETSPFSEKAEETSEDLS